MSCRQRSPHKPMLARGAVKTNNSLSPFDRRRAPASFRSGASRAVMCGLSSGHLTGTRWPSNGAVMKIVAASVCALLLAMLLPAPDALGRCVLREPVHGRAARTRRSRWRRRSRPDRSRRRAPGTATAAVARAAGVLPRRRDAEADRRLRHQDRGVDAGVRLERQVPGGRQRRVQRRDRLPGDDDGAGQRLRDQLHRHRPHRRQRAASRSAIRRR